MAEPVDYDGLIAQFSSIVGVPPSQVQYCVLLWVG